MTQTNINNKHIEKHYDNMLLALLPLIFCGTILYGARVLLVCATGLITARVVDVMVSMVRKQENDPSDKTSTVAALTFCMLLPVNIPLYVVIMTVSLVTFIGKHVFGGKDVYPFSLAALSMCVAAVNWPNKVFQAVAPFTKVSFWSGASTSTISGVGTIKQGGLPYISTLDLFLGNYAGTIGSSFILVIVALGIYLMATKRISWQVPVAFVVTCCVFAILFPRIYGISRFESFKFEILNGSLIFCAIFLLSEPATTPKTSQAKIIFGVLAGVLGMLFRYFGSYEIGICFALLLVNAVEGFFDRVILSGVNLNIAQLIKDSKMELKKSKNKIEVDINNIKVELKDENVIEEKTNIIKEDNKQESDIAKQPVQEEIAEDVVEEWILPEPIVKKAKTKKARNPRNNKEHLEEALNIISRTEDDIDGVSFSTQTIDMQEALRILQEEKNKGGNKNGKK